jgi:hypothetical protein
MGGILGLIGSVAMAVAVFLPWASIKELPGFDLAELGIDLSVYGTSIFQGYLVLFLAVACLVCSILAIALSTSATRKAFGIVLLASGVAAAVATSTQLSEIASYGIYVSLAGAATLVVAGSLALYESRRLVPAQQPVWTPPPPPPE